MQEVNMYRVPMPDCLNVLGKFSHRTQCQLSLKRLQTLLLPCLTSHPTRTLPEDRTQHDSVNRGHYRHHRGSRQPTTSYSSIAEAHEEQRSKSYHPSGSRSHIRT